MATAQKSGLLISVYASTRSSSMTPGVARTLGAVLLSPVWLGRMVIGEVGVSMMTQIRGALNAKAKRE